MSRTRFVSALRNSAPEIAKAAWYQAGTPLAQSIVGLWKLDEASGNRAASVGSVPLTDNATVTSAAGIVYPLAAEFAIANLEFLSALDSAPLSACDWGSCWFRPAAVNVTACVMGKFHASANSREWQIAQVNADVWLQVSPDGTATANALVSVAGVLAENVWTHVLWTHDAVNDLIKLYINGELTGSAAHSTGVFDGVAAFIVGRQGATGVSHYGGRVQQVCLGKGHVPTAQDAFTIANREVAYGVRSLHYIGYGGHPNFSPDGTQIVFGRRDSDGEYQIHLMDSDGSNEHSLTNPIVPGGPALDRHKGYPYWHPSGDFIVVQAEIAGHGGDHANAYPGYGWWNDVWVLTADGQTWWKLTNYSADPFAGVLNPRFSHDGTKLLWARRIGLVSAPAPFAVWNLQLADFSIVDGVPTLGSITTLTPGSGSFYESHGFSRDDTKILFTSDAGLANPYGLDVYSYTIVGGTLVNMSNSPTEWDEHSSWAHHTDKISFMSTRPYPAYDADDVPTIGLAQLRSELIVMNPDGSDRQQLTHFNVPSFAEYNAERSVTTVSSWHPSGTKVAVAQYFLGASDGTVTERKLWMVNFNGVYE